VEALRAQFSRQLEVFKAIGFDLDFLVPHFGNRTLLDVSHMVENKRISVTTQQKKLLETFLENKYSGGAHMAFAAMLKLLPGEVLADLAVDRFEVWRINQVGGTTFGRTTEPSHAPAQEVTVLQHFGDGLDAVNIAIVSLPLFATLIAPFAKRLGPNLTQELIHDGTLAAGFLAAVAFELFQNFSHPDVLDILGSTPSIALLKLAGLLSSKAIDGILLARYTGKVRRDKRTAQLSSPVIEAAN
jgi:hypothetical protein